MSYAEESNLGAGVTTFDNAALQLAINKIRTAGEDYRTEYNKLANYFENELQQVVQGETLAAFKRCFDEEKTKLKAVNDFIDELLEPFQKKTNEGSDMIDDLNGRI